MTNFTEFDSVNVDNQSGNFLCLKFPEALGKPENTIKFLLKGSQVNQQEPKSVDPSDGMICVKVHAKNNTIELTGDDYKTRELVLADLDLKAS